MADMLFAPGTQEACCGVRGWR